MPRYVGRHRPPTTPAWRRASTVVPATAALATIAAAGVSSTAGASSSGILQLGQHTPTEGQWQRSVDASGRQSTSYASVSASVTKAKNARVRAAAAASAKATAAKAAAARKAAVSALGTGTTATSMDAPQSSTASGSTTTGGATTASANTSRSSARAATTSVGGWTCPIAGCGGSFTSGFGFRSSPGGIGSTNHMGDDFSTPVGTPLRALHSGTVTAVGWYGGQGLRVEVDFGGGISAVYAHMSSTSVSVGQSVGGGQLVGYSGSTGNSTGPHLHLEIHINGSPIDPAPWLRAHGIF